MTNEIVQYQQHDMFLPVMALEVAIQRRDQLVGFVQRIMRADHDFGKIPGTDKNVLLKPGAEKLCTFFGLAPVFVPTATIQDWGGEEHGGEPLFYYRYKCELYRSGNMIATGEGSCSSRESKYRYRKAERVCPQCGKPAIIKGNVQYGGGWLCFKKKDGCGAKFGDKDPAIIGQEVGRVFNPDVADLDNTILKMAQKRCLSGSTPIVIKTSRGITRTKIETLATIFENGNEDVFVPGTDGDWRQVRAICKTPNARVSRISLADGSYILATANHRFPTTDGLKHVYEISSGDVLVRSVIPMTDGASAMTEIAWVAGLFLAEGNFNRQGGSVSTRFTLHDDETEYADSVTRLAERVGATWSISKKDGKCFSLNVNGQGFAGLIADFVDGETSEGKHFSKRAFNQGKAFLRAMLDGYLAGDGSWTEREGREDHWRIGFTGENRELAKDLHAVCAMLGLRFSLKRSRSKIKSLEYPTYVGWIKRDYVSYNQVNLASVESVEDEPNLCTVYDIEVDGNHLFLLGNGIQTHNSLIAAVLIGVNASEFFTQDIEDFVEDDVIDVVATKATASVNKVFADQEPSLSQDADEHPFNDPAQPRLGTITQAQRNTLHALGVALYGDSRAWDVKRPGLVKWASNSRVESSALITQAEAKTLIEKLEGKIREQYDLAAQELLERQISQPDVDPDVLFGVELANNYGVLSKLLNTEPVATGK